MYVYIYILDGYVNHTRPLFVIISSLISAENVTFERATFLLRMYEFLGSNLNPETNYSDGILCGLFPILYLQVP